MILRAVDYVRCNMTDKYTIRAVRDTIRAANVFMQKNLLELLQVIRESGIRNQSYFVKCNKLHNLYNYRRHESKFVFIW